MRPWFQLPAEIRTRVYEYAFGGLVFQPLQRPPSLEADTKVAAHRAPSPSFMSLAVSRQWRTEVAPYLLPTATFDFTAHPGDPPSLVSAKAYQAMRHVVILETHCFSTDWLCQVFDKMPQVETITIRKLRRVGTLDASAFDGPGITHKFIERIKMDPIKTLLGGYRFDHQYVKEMLKSKWPQRKVFLEGSLWPGQSGAAHSHFRVDLDRWTVRVEGLLPGAKPYEIEATEPAPVGRAHFEDEEDMFGYLMGQHFASLQHGHSMF